LRARRQHTGCFTKTADAQLSVRPDEDAPRSLLNGMLAMQIPAYFREDLMRLAGERRRPPHRSGPLDAEAFIGLVGRGHALSSPDLTFYAQHTSHTSKSHTTHVQPMRACLVSRPHQFIPMQPALSPARRAAPGRAIALPAAWAPPDASRPGQRPAQRSTAEGPSDPGPDHAAPRRQVAGAGPGAQRVRPAHRPARDRRLERAAGGPQALGAVPARRARPARRPGQPRKQARPAPAGCASWHARCRVRGGSSDERGPAQHTLWEGFVPRFVNPWLPHLTSLFHSWGRRPARAGGPARARAGARGGELVRARVPAHARARLAQRRAR